MRGKETPRLACVVGGVNERRLTASRVEKKEREKREGSVNRARFAAGRLEFHRLLAMLKMKLGDRDALRNESVSENGASTDATGHPPASTVVRTSAGILHANL